MMIKIKLMSFLLIGYFTVSLCKLVVQVQLTICNFINNNSQSSVKNTCSITALNSPNRKFVVYSQKSSAVPSCRNCPLHYQFIYGGIKQLYF
jgi:hypothetical protein